MAQPTLEEVERLAAQLPAADRVSLALNLAGRNSQGEIAAQADKPIAHLRDKYAGAVPDEFDIDVALRECRSEWLKEIDAMIDGRDIP